MVNYIIVGTSHISSQSLNDIQDSIDTHSPDFVAVELDFKRLHALFTHQKSRLSPLLMFKVGVKGYLFALIGSFVQKRLGKYVGVMPGSDMLFAVKEARRRKIKVMLIDQDIEITLRRLSQSFTWRERFRFVGDIVRGMLFPQQEIKKFGLNTLDLRSVPPHEMVEKLVGALKSRYPSLHNVLLTERNDVMITRLKLVGKKFPESTIVVVVGAGHKAELERALCVHDP